MKTYKIIFRGRRVGAIGKIPKTKLKEVVSAENEEKAIISLYDRHEHISVLSIEVLN